MVMSMATGAASSMVKAKVAGVVIIGGAVIGGGAFLWKKYGSKLRDLVMGPINAVKKFWEKYNPAATLGRIKEGADKAKERINAGIARAGEKFKSAAANAKSAFTGATANAKKFLTSNPLGKGLLSTARTAINASPLGTGLNVLRGIGSGQSVRQSVGSALKKNPIFSAVSKIPLVKSTAASAKTSVANIFKKPLPKVALPKIGGLFRRR